MESKRMFLPFLFPFEVESRCGFLWLEPMTGGKTVLSSLIFYTGKECWWPETETSRILPSHSEWIGSFRGFAYGRKKEKKNKLERQPHCVGRGKDRQKSVGSGQDFPLDHSNRGPHKGYIYTAKAHNRLASACWRSLGTQKTSLWLLWSIFKDFFSTTFFPLPKTRQRLFS